MDFTLSIAIGVLALVFQVMFVVIALRDVATQLRRIATSLESARRLSFDNPIQVRFDLPNTQEPR